MATGDDTSKQLRESILLGSDADFDISCDLCNDDGNLVEAEGYCVDCGEYLCRACYNVHRKTRASRQHVLQDKGKMPNEKDRKPVFVSDVYFTEQCLKHKDEHIKYYCRQHDKVGCSVCVTIEHRLCEGIAHIPDIAEDLTDSQEYESLINDLNNLRILSKSVSAAAKANASKAEKIKSNAIKSVNQLIQDVYNSLQQFEEAVRKDIEPKTKNDVENMESVSARSDSFIREIERTVYDLNSMLKNKQFCRLFVMAKATKDRVKTLEKCLGELKASIKVTRYEFHPSVDVQSLIDYPETWGDISVIYDKTITGVSQNNDSNSEYMEAKHVTDIFVRSLDDKWTSTISGLSVLSDNRLVLVDWKNPVVKLVDTSAGRVISKTATESQPWDVARITNEKVVVTVPYEKRILVIKVSEKLVVEKEIKVNGHCRGIAVKNDQLIVSFGKPIKVEILDFSGALEKTIMSRLGDPTLEQWVHVAVCPNQGAYLVSDSNQNSVVLKRQDILDKYQDNQLKSPSGIDVDERGRVFVCGSKSGNIILLSPDLTTIQVLVSGLSKPRSVCVCPYTSKLYVGFDDNDYIKVYRLA